MIFDKHAGSLAVDVEQRLFASYAPRPYCVQYRESDLDFVGGQHPHQGLGRPFDLGQPLSQDLTDLALGAAGQGDEDIGQGFGGAAMVGGGFVEAGHPHQQAMLIVRGACLGQIQQLIQARQGHGLRGLFGV